MDSFQQRDLEEEEFNRNLLTEEDSEYDPDLFADTWQADTLALPPSTDPDAWWIY